MLRKSICITHAVDCSLSRGLVPPTRAVFGTNATRSGNMKIGLVANNISLVTISGRRKRNTFRQTVGGGAGGLALKSRFMSSQACVVTTALEHLIQSRLIICTVRAEPLQGKDASVPYVLHSTPLFRAPPLNFHRCWPLRCSIHWYTACDFHCACTQELVVLLKSGAIRRNKSNGSEWFVLDFVSGCFELLMLPTEVEKAAWQRSIGQPPCFG